MWERTRRTPDDLLELVGVRRKEMYKAGRFILTEIDRQTDTRTVLGSDFGSPLFTDIGAVRLN